MNTRRVVPSAPSAERAALLTLLTRATRGADPDTSLDELAGLASAAGAQVVVRAVQERASANPATLFGKGKAAEFAAACKAADVEIVIIDHVLTPAQARNLSIAAAGPIVGVWREGAGGPFSGRCIAV